ncbi:hypothetical protein [Clostridium beijerinckii]|uniref:Guanylate cyclase domain-containing protein n=1 Tax=Clostridium beijerinckii TaxID=1520 RepID=A0AAW3W9M6_CLOBE|nr:hypothetical protein [Clostridium beijerinckii]MBC2457018.1 hypothetical protein [Clostridium beijerinckii]MBC2475590.1 hypothetical protein [Clostridium beijerinckii]NOV63108.1 hypothetical protein [Clostridium beijerinckii]NOV69930.1 hypothetical protein [Clostridium beijerinckii]NOW31163.1 hypothetical protein [Clostridium beijerinckii]
MYENRVVLFIDILGFKNLIYKNQDNTTKITEIIKLIEKLHDLCSKTGEEDDLKFDFNYNRQVSVFSDNIVISYKDEGPAEFYIAREAMVIQGILQSLGINVRGGLTKGELYHRGDIIVGPALIRAYQLESKIAIFPRIVVDRIMEADWCMLAKDFDGIYFLDYLGNVEIWSAFLEYNEDIKTEECLLKINSEIFIDCSTDLRVSEKYGWMKKYISESIECINGRVNVIRFNKGTYIR